MLDKERKLLPKEKVLCGEGAARAAWVASERDSVQNNRPDIWKTVARASLSTFLRRRWRPRVEPARSSRAWQV